MSYANTDYIIIKYDNLGNQIWLNTYNGTRNDSDHARGLAIDNSGNLYVTGESWGYKTACDIITIKYSEHAAATPLIDSSEWIFIILLLLSLAFVFLCPVKGKVLHFEKSFKISFKLFNCR